MKYNVIYNITLKRVIPVYVEVVEIPVMDDEKLISIVQKYPEIYDMSNSNYHNQQRRDNVWEEIAEEMIQPVSECKKRWASLRDTYRKIMKLQETKSGDAARKRKSWRFESQMTFMRQFLANRQQISNVEDPEVHENVSLEQESTTQPASPAANTSAKKSMRRNLSRHHKEKSRSTADVLNNYLEYRMARTERHTTADPIGKFFESMSEIVKTLDQPLQIELKSQIFALVNDAERKQMYQNSQVSSHPQFHSLQQYNYTPSSTSISSPNPSIFSPSPQENFLN